MTLGGIPTHGSLWSGAAAHGDRTRPAGISPAPNVYPHPMGARETVQAIQRLTPQGVLARSRTVDALKRLTQNRIVNRDVSLTKDTLVEFLHRRFGKTLAEALLDT